MLAVNLGDLISPMSPDEFRNGLLGQRQHIFDGPATRFSKMLPWAELNRILRYHYLDSTRIRLTANHKAVPQDEYNPYVPTFPGTRSPARHRELDVGALTRLLGAGATMKIRAIDELHEPIARLAASAEQIVRERVSIDAFISWGETPGYGVHWDPDEVLVIQVHGRKNWAVYGPTKPWPPIVGSSVFGPGSPDDAPEDPLQRLVLTTGQMLFIPRGWWHEVTPINEPSVHLSLHFARSTGLDLITWLAARMDEAVLQQDLPRPAEMPERSRQYLQLFREAVLSRLSSPALLDAFFTSHDGALPCRDAFNLPEALNSDGFPQSQDYWVIWLASSAILTSEKQETTIHTAGRRYRFAAEWLPALTVLAQGEPLSIEDIGRRAGMATDTVRKIVAELLTEGLAAVKRTAPGSTVPFGNLPNADPDAARQPPQGKETST
ncbi:cupin domain-containing protein [Streptomyces sp. NPDC005805]|uniref:JmjC domain-containing protein n=1 Tax=Streptomyces sp. NPDC005805 TaxID=3157068 RepID=UPI00340ACEA2